MKRNVMIVLCTLLCVTGMYGCGTKTAENTTVQEDTEHVVSPEDENATYGEIKSLGEDTVTLALGTRKKMEKDSNTTGESGQESMLDLTGETKEFTITEDTKVIRQEMKGERPSDGEIPEKPDHEPSDGEMPQKPDNEPSDGEIPEKPDHEPSDGEMPQKPDHEPSDGEKPEGEEIAWSDLQEGDTVAITVDENDNIKEIRLMTRRNEK